MTLDSIQKKHDLKLKKRTKKAQKSPFAYGKNFILELYKKPCKKKKI